MNSMDAITKNKIAYKLRGKKQKARTKMLISRAMSGKSKTEEHKQAISDAMKRYWQQFNKTEKE